MLVPVRAIRARPPRVALLVVLLVGLAGCGGSGGSSASPEEGGAAEGEATFAITGTNDLTWDREELDAPAGEISVALSCEDAVNHDFTVLDADGQGGEESVAECAPGETTTGSIELEPGEYTYICDIPGHERSMRGTLTVG